MNSQVYSRVIVLLLVVTTTAASRTMAQIASTATIDSNAVMGFETPLAWAAKSSESTKISESATTTRTQGSYALMVSNPGNLVTLVSAPVASTATPLAGVSNSGALFELDVILPSIVGNANNTGQIQMYVNSPSRNLSKVFVGDVLFAGYRPGIYNTLQFAVPSAVGTALGGASFTDLTFTFMISSPGKTTGPYLLDNLRVHSVPFEAANAGTQPPPGYGGSVDFVVIGGAPVTKSFNIGVVQVPAGFHLKLGTTGPTTIQLELGYDGTASFTCTYNPDPNDATSKNYVLNSCSDEVQAGDLTPANWASLNIVGGDSTVKLRAQLAENPIGDQLGGGIIPAMPTYWGDFTSCVPAVAADGVVPPNPPPSSSCASQTAEANQIVTNYSDALKDTYAPPIWIVTPKSEFATRHGNGLPYNNLLGPPPPNDPNFDDEGHMCSGCFADAYWRVNGFLNYTPSDTIDSTDFNAEASVHAVFFGGDVNVADVETTMHTGDPTDPSTASAASGQVTMHLLGVALPLLEGGTITPGPNFDYPFKTNEDFFGGTVGIWIFSIGETLSADIDMDVNGGLQDTGINVNVVPSVDVALHLEGGVNVGFASGGVDVQVDLLKFEGNLSGSAGWQFDTDPTACYADADVSLNGDVTLSSGGGEVDLTASFLTFDETWTLFSWAGLPLEGPMQLFDPVKISTAPIGKLPTAQCAKTPTITFSQPPSTVLQGIQYPLAASATWLGSCNLANPANPITFTWISSKSGDSPNPTVACPASITFNSTGVRTLTVNASGAATDFWGRQIALTSGPVSEQINVIPASPGPIITGIICGGGSCPAFTPGQSNVLINVEGMNSLQFVGQVVGAPGPTSTAWNVNCNDNGAMLFANLGTFSGTTVTSGAWTLPLILSGQSITCSLQMSTITTSPPAWGGIATLGLTLYVPVQ